MSKMDPPTVIFVSSFVSRDMNHIRLPVVCSENRSKAGKTMWASFGIRWCNGFVIVGHDLQKQTCLHMLDFNDIA